MKVLNAPGSSPLHNIVCILTMTHTFRK